MVQQDITQFNFTYDDKEIYYTSANNEIHKVNITNLSNIEIATKSDNIQSCSFNADSEKVIYINSEKKIVSSKLLDEEADDELLHFEMVDMRFMKLS